MTIQDPPSSLSDITAAVRRALSRWGLPTDTEINLLNLSENLTFRAGQETVLRVHRLGYHAADEIRSELAWIDALRRENAVETPPFLAGVDGDPVQTLAMRDGRPTRHAVAFAFAPGTEPAATDADLSAWFGRLGSVTARLHGHAQRWTPPSEFRRKTWDWDAMFGPQPLWGDWRAGVGLDPAGTALLGRALDLIRRRLAGFGRSPPRFGLIHADLRLANLLVDGPHLRVIDFDDCGFGWHLYDFAAAVSFFEHEPIVAELRDAWIDGYRTVAPLSEGDVTEMPVFVAMRRFLLVAWIASHPEVPIAQQLGAAYTAGALDIADQLLSDFA